MRAQHIPPDRLTFREISKRDGPGVFEAKLLAETWSWVARSFSYPAGKIDPEKVENEMMKEKIVSMVESNPHKAAMIIGEWLHAEGEAAGKGAGKATNDGVIVCVFRIQSHFDIKRSYNSTTGEQMNVVEENGSDRP